MTSVRQPWYLSITAKWKDAEQFGSLKTCLDGLPYKLPFYHLSIPHDSWHSTVFAVAKLHKFPHGKVASLHAQELLQEFLAVPGFTGQLQAAYQSFAVQPHQLSCFDDATTVEFVQNEGITGLRDRLRDILLHPFESIAGYRTGIEPLLQHEVKSRGPKFFGSIARSAHSTEARGARRWEVVLPTLPPLSFSRVHFLVSDDGLTNEHTSANCFTIDC